jgi:hypothetical protein
VASGQRHRNWRGLCPQYRHTADGERWDCIASVRVIGCHGGTSAGAIARMRGRVTRANHSLQAPWLRLLLQLLLHPRPPVL